MCDRLLKTPINGFRALLEKVQTKLDISKQKKIQSKQKKSERMSVKVSFLCQKNRAKILKMRLGKLVWKIGEHF